MSDWKKAAIIATLTPEEIDKLTVDKSSDKEDQEFVEMLFVSEEKKRGFFIPKIKGAA